MNIFSRSSLVCSLIMVLMILMNVMILGAISPTGDSDHILYVISACTYPVFLIGLLGFIISTIGYFMTRGKEKRAIQ